MEPVLEFLALWWWTAPAAAGVGTVGYVTATTGRRRARRLALDAARHEEQCAARAVLTARAETRSAQAELQAAKAGQGLRSGEARRLLTQARAAQRTATLALRAARSRVRAERAHLHASGTEIELPLTRLVHEHDAIAARWLEYETDIELAIAVPQMSDPHHPITAAYLRAMQRAQWLRPPAGAQRMAPADFIAYRTSVHELAAAFDAAEDAALRASAASAHRVVPRAAPPASPLEAGPAPAPSTGETPTTARPVWPVPRRTSSND